MFFIRTTRLNFWCVVFIDFVYQFKRWTKPLRLPLTKLLELFLNSENSPPHNEGTHLILVAFFLERRMFVVLYKENKLINSSDRNSFGSYFILLLFFFFVTVNEFEFSPTIFHSAKRIDLSELESNDIPNRYRTFEPI